MEETTPLEEVHLTPSSIERIVGKWLKPERIRLEQADSVLEVLEADGAEAAQEQLSELVEENNLAESQPNIT